MKTLMVLPLLGLWVLEAWAAFDAEAIEVVTEPSGKAVQSAIDACAAKGGGVAYLPPGRYVTGPLWLKDNVELRLEAGATVVMSPERKDWPAGVRALVNAKGVKRIAITGRGTFDGNAQWEYEPVRGQDPEIAERHFQSRAAELSSSSGATRFGTPGDCEGKRNGATRAVKTG